MPKDFELPSPAATLLRLLSFLPAALFFAGACFEIRALDMIYYRVIPFAESSAIVMPCAVLVAAAAALLLRKPVWNGILLPGVLFWPLVFFPLEYLTLPAGFALGAWIVFRTAAARTEPWRQCDLSSAERYVPLLIVLFYLLAASWGFHMQRHASRALFLFYQDWGEYATNYLRLAFQDGHSLRDFLAVAGHWNPLPTLVMTGLIRIAPAPETIFAVNALLIYSVIPLSYLLARKLGFTRPTAALFALLGALNPTISNQPLSLFYGFHPINFMIPAIFGFFLCRACRKRTGMYLVLGISFLIQETVAVFWAGYALYLLTRRKYAAGIALFLGSVAFFFLISMAVMPRSLDAEHYSQMFHYAQLGNTPIEVALSPFLRPGAFFGTVLQWQNFAFVFTLLLPELFLLVSFPRLAVATVPLFAGVCLQNSPDVKNIVMQYGLEITVLLLVMAILNANKLRCGRNSRVLKFLAAPFPAVSGKHLLPAALVAVCFSTVCCYYFFGKGPWIGKYSYAAVERLPECDAALDFLKSKIPPESRVFASQRLRGHFIFEFETAAPDADALRTGDTIVLDLHDVSSAGELEKLRRRLAADPRVRPVTMANSYGNQLVLFRVAPPDAPLTSLPFLLSGVENTGMPYPCDDPHFAIRIGESAAGKLRIGVEVLSVPTYDVDLQLLLRGADGAIEQFRIPFAYGLKPAYATQPGDIFLWEPTDQVPREINLNLSVRPESDFSGALP